jgi:hypothetical protein
LPGKDTLFPVKMKLVLLYFGKAIAPFHRLIQSCFTFQSFCKHCAAHQICPACCKPPKHRNQLLQPKRISISIRFGLLHTVQLFPATCSVSQIKIVMALNLKSMNTFNLKLIWILICSSILTLACKKDDQASEQKKLEKMYAEIQAMAETSTCNGNQELKYIAVGSKACGGPFAYLAYSSSIDMYSFERLVAQYNQYQGNYNKKWNVASDCTFLMPPKGITCENGKPKLVR